MLAIAPSALGANADPLQTTLARLQALRASWMFAKDVDDHIVVETANSTGASSAGKVVSISSSSVLYELDSPANLADRMLLRVSIQGLPADLRARIAAYDKATPGSPAKWYLGTVPQLRANIDQWIAALTSKIARGEAPASTTLLKQPLVWGAAVALVLGGALLLKRR